MGSRFTRATAPQSTIAASSTTATWVSISGGVTNAHYTNNYTAQVNQASFAALMVDHFNSAALGDFTGATLSGNTVVCSAPCHFGIELGPHPWYASSSAAQH